MPVDVLKGMNPNQAVAVAHIDGPLLVIAGAGSGKTRVITHRIANLIQHEVRPDHILAITFTNKAAGEMQERVRRLLGLETPWISTFHSVGLRLLKLEYKAAGLDERPLILDQNDQKTLFRGIIKEGGWEKIIDPRGLGWQISQWKNALKAPDEVQVADDKEDEMLKAYRRYDAIIRRENLLDFDDLLMLPVKLFQANEALRRVYQERFPYILIDEYQDTNSAQYAMVRLLGAHGNVCATGDPDQAIYGWRGADISNILNFEKDFPGCKTVLLEQNYRSTKYILRAAQSVVEHNEERKNKTCFTDNDDGRPLTLITVDDHFEEAKAIAIRCQTLQDQGRSLHEMAVFYRTNAQSRIFEEEFIRRDLPYQLIGGVRFYDRAEIKDVLAYLRLLVNPRDTISFERIINVPARRIGKKTLGALRDRALDEGVSLHDIFIDDDLLERVAVGRNARSLRDFALLWRRLQRLDRKDAGECVREIIQITGLDEFYRDREPGEPGEERVHNILELQSAAEQQDTVEHFLDHVSLFTSVDFRTQPDQVVLMTLHGSKGLEFPCVFIAGCEQGLLPLVHYGRDADYEEERRLMYVGITRAMEELYLSRAVMRMQMGETRCNPPSMFLGEIPDACIEHRDCTGRILPSHSGRARQGPAYPKDSSASLLLGGQAPVGARGKALIEDLKQRGALTSGAALLAASRAGSSADGVTRKARPSVEPVILDSDPYVPGDHIEHALFGPGTVIECKGRPDNRRIVLALADGAIKELVLELAARHLSPAGDPEGDEAPF